MGEQESDSLRYPTGQFIRPEKFYKGETKRNIREIDKFPKRLKDSVKSLSDEQLETAYRDGGWTLRQVVNHCADSHLNAYCRIKLALTESNPLIKTYNEKLWAELVDGKTADIRFSLNMLASLHKRWVMLLKSLEKEDLHKTFHHPEQNRNIPIYELIALYAWHCNHHLAHITQLKQRKGWE